MLDRLMIAVIDPVTFVIVLALLWHIRPERFRWGLVIGAIIAYGKCAWLNYPHGGTPPSHYLVWLIACLIQGGAAFTLLKLLMRRTTREISTSAQQARRN
ncbi:hypothetical protein [Dongshaea marina]|uniref:hypothetical protein n=1 Tax=Dongshaea marina TaxID=2047966 RepID=UPI000D3EA97F|nr:hypothetical protein [Dongshaea marina]